MKAGNPLYLEASKRGAEIAEIVDKHMEPLSISDNHLNTML